MKFKEFDLTEQEKIVLLKKHYPDLNEEQINEILPAIGAAMGTVAGGIARVGAQAVGTAARGLARGASALGKAGAKAAGRGLAKGAKAAGRAVARGATNSGQRNTNNPNSTVGTQVKKGSSVSIGSQGTQSTQSTQGSQNNKPIQKGASLKLATGPKGKMPKYFKVTGVDKNKNTVTIQNPKAKDGEPKELVYDIDAIQQVRK